MVGGNDAETRKSFVVVASVWLFLVSAAGGSVLTWWILWFYPSNEQQWMAPVGLVLFTTPILVWLSVATSELIDKFERLRGHPPELPPECHV